MDGRSSTTGGFEVLSQAVHPFVYVNGKSVNLTLLLPPVDGGYVVGYATALNIRDQVVGYQNFSPKSFLYQNGKALIFGMPNSLWTRATSINDFGQIVGNFDGNVEGALEHPFLRQPRGKMSDLGTFGGISAMASAINDRGQIAVNVDRADGSFHALLVHPGGTASSDLGSFTYANGLNQLGQVVGSVQVSPAVFTPDYVPAVYHAIRYSGGRKQDLGTPSGFDSSSANEINNFGLVVGSAWDR